VKIDLIVGCRPNFVKAAALLHAAKDFPQIEFKVIHTGQHTNEMSDPYFKDLRLPKPETFLQIPVMEGPPERLGAAIVGLSLQFRDDKPDYVMVVGDTDSTLAGAIAAAKRGIPILHVEAGLRCGDFTMQEELNRRIVDSVSTAHYATSQFAVENLKLESREHHVRLVGNVMVDTLLRFLPEARQKFARKGPYAILTLHRAENADNPERLKSIVRAVEEVSKHIQVLRPVHPRLGTFWFNAASDICDIPPMGYLEFIAALESAQFVMTDSGGVQEETTALHVPCLTLRDSTERPETVEFGTNRVIGTDSAAIIKEGVELAEHPQRWRRCSQIPLWDGLSAKRIMEDICATL
jgi:UDP-N-acetylglucosamine 2-epimerase (non-hydrolysing)